MEAIPILSEVNLMVGIEAPPENPIENSMCIKIRIDGTRVTEVEIRKQTCNPEEDNLIKFVDVPVTFFDAKLHFKSYLDDHTLIKRGDSNLSKIVLTVGVKPPPEKPLENTMYFKIALEGTRVTEVKISKHKYDPKEENAVTFAEVPVTFFSAHLDFKSSSSDCTFTKGGF